MCVCVCVFTKSSPNNNREMCGCWLVRRPPGTTVLISTSHPQATHHSHPPSCTGAQMAHPP